jgi:thymidylate synthase ThyX
MYKAEIVADSLNLQGDRITSLLVTYPRIIHGEFMTHRMFSRNAASSRAIPFKKMVKDVQDNPFIPIAWQKHHSGMQGTEYIQVPYIEDCRLLWIEARDLAIQKATELYEYGVTKQLCNRLLEPFQYITVLVTATEWDNFFKLRCPEYTIDVPGDSIEDNWETKSFRSKRDVKKAMYSDDIDNWTDVEWLEINKSQAEIHIQHLAELIWDARNESTPKQLKAGEWHIPFGDKIDKTWLEKGAGMCGYHRPIDEINFMEKLKLQVATARCARLSYMTLGAEPKIDYAADIRLHDGLYEDEHASPFEHCAKAMSESEYDCYSIDVPRYKDANPGYLVNRQNGWCRNFRGFIQYRALLNK